jgi:hypothetical protein
MSHTPLQISQWLHTRDRECVLLQRKRLACLISCSSHDGCALEFTQSEAWKSFCKKLLYVALALGGQDFVCEIQTCISDLSSNRDSLDLFSWLVSAMPGVAWTSLHDYQWLVSADIIAGKVGGDQRDLIISTEPDDSPRLLSRSLPVLLRLLVWKRAADIMPGQSDLWQQELSREVGNRSANLDSIAKQFLNSADLQDIFEFDSHISQFSVAGCPSSFDLPWGRPKNCRKKNCAA